MHNLPLFFAALADENRLRLLYLMKEGEICVCYLQGVLQASQPKISRHLAYLKRAGLVEARLEHRNRYYRARREALGAAAEILERMWDDALWKLKLAAELEETRRGPKPQRRKNKRKATRTTNAST